jgi:Zn-dependent protease
LIGLFFFPNNDIIFNLGFMGSFINLFLGAFNMIPFGNLDGSKILKWNPLVWVVMIILLAGPVITFYAFSFGFI